MVLFAAVTEMTKPPVTELSRTRNTPSVAVCGARILVARSRLMAAWYQACRRCTLACVSVSRSATGAATRRLEKYLDVRKYLHQHWKLPSFKFCGV